MRPHKFPNSSIRLLEAAFERGANHFSEFAFLVKFGNFLIDGHRGFVGGKNETDRKRKSRI
jgi:hypothetical protein